ncbi:MAG: septum formation initiator family protein [Thermodesulfobacteriota bacterium]
MGKKVKGKRKKSAGKGVRGFHVFIVLIFAIALLAVFGDRGLTDVLRIKGERDRLLSTNRGLEAKNRDMREKIAFLKKDKRYIGEIARNELGMIGRNEVIYRFRESR